MDLDLVNGHVTVGGASDLLLERGDPAAETQVGDDEGPVNLADGQLDDDDDETDGEGKPQPEYDETMQVIAGSDHNHGHPRPEPQLYPIEVVLSPPQDRANYKRLPPSWVVGEVLEEIKAGDEVWYSVEFDDGRIDQVSAEILLLLYTPWLSPLFCISPRRSSFCSINPTGSYQGTCFRSHNCLL